MWGCRSGTAAAAAGAGAAAAAAAGAAGGLGPAAATFEASANIKVAVINRVKNPIFFMRFSSSEFWRGRRRQIDPQYRESSHENSRHPHSIAVVSANSPPHELTP